MANPAPICLLPNATIDLCANIHSYLVIHHR